MSGGLTFPALTDIVVRILTCSANNTEVIANWDMYVIDA